MILIGKLKYKPHHGDAETRRTAGAGKTLPLMNRDDTDRKTEVQTSPRRRGDTENSQDRKPKTFTTEDTKEHRGKIGKAKPYHE
jgi:hypothetical protein